MKVRENYQNLTQEQFDDYKQDIECDFDSSYGDLSWGDPMTAESFSDIKRIYLYAENKEEPIADIVYEKNENDEYTIYDEELEQEDEEER